MDSAIAVEESRSNDSNAAEESRSNDSNAASSVEESISRNIHAFSFNVPMEIIQILFSTGSGRMSPSEKVDMLILALFLRLKEGGEIAEAMSLIERLDSECAFRCAMNMVGDHQALVSFIKAVWARKFPPLEEALVIDVLPFSTSTATMTGGSSSLACTTTPISVQGYSMVAPSDSAEQETLPSLASTTVDPSTPFVNIIDEVESGEESEDSEAAFRHVQ